MNEMDIVVIRDTPTIWFITISRVIKPLKSIGWFCATTADNLVVVTPGKTELIRNVYFIITQEEVDTIMEM